MPNTLVILLGNRDIQISGEKLINLKGTLYYPLFVENVDGGEYYVIDKSGNEKNGKLSFLDASKLIWEKYDYFIPLIRFELYEKTMQILEKEGAQLDKVVITTSDQPQRHQQDCYFVALCLQKYLQSKGIVCELRLCAANPNNFDMMVPFYGNLFSEYAKDGSNLYISNTGGTPTMRSASHFAGLFQGYRYISIDPSSANESKVYQKQENQVLRQIVEKMLLNYDYAGVMQLPLQNPSVLQLAEYAQVRLLLDHERLRTLTVTLPHDLTLPTKISRLELMREVALSALVKHRQRAYGDYLWRIFSIGDNLLIPEIERLLGGEVVHTPKDKHATWNGLLQKDQDLIRDLDLRKINGEPLKYQEPNSFAYQAILKYHSEKGRYSMSPELEALVKLIDNLRGLRNGIAHNMKGISKDVVEEKISQKLLLKGGMGIDGLNRLLAAHLNFALDKIDVYDPINLLIISEL